MMKYRDVPYKHRGRDVDGADCYGFVRLVMADAGIKLPAYEFHGCGGEKKIAMELIEGEELERPEDYSLIYLNNGGRGEHIGVYLSGAVWHMTRDGAVSVAWKRIKERVNGIYRIKG